MASPTVNQFCEMSTECSGLSWRICSLPFVRMWNISRPYTPQQVLGRGHEVWGSIAQEAQERIQTKRKIIQDFDQLYKT